MSTLAAVIVFVALFLGFGAICMGFGWWLRGFRIDVNRARAIRTAAELRDSLPRRTGLEDDSARKIRVTPGRATTEVEHDPEWCNEGGHPHQGPCVPPAPWDKQRAAPGPARPNYAGAPPYGAHRARDW